MACIFSSGVNVGVRNGVGTAVDSSARDEAGMVEDNAVGETVGAFVGSEEEQAANLRSNAATPINQKDLPCNKDRKRLERAIAKAWPLLNSTGNF